MELMRIMRWVISSKLINGKLIEPLVRDLACAARCCFAQPVRSNNATQKFCGIWVTGYASHWLHGTPRRSPAHWGRLKVDIEGAEEAVSSLSLDRRISSC